MSNFDKLEPEDEIEILKCSRDAWEADAKRYAANADYWRERDANDLAALTAARAALAHQERKVADLEAELTAEHGMVEVEQRKVAELTKALLRGQAELENLLAPTPKGLGDLRSEYLRKLRGSALDGIEVIRTALAELLKEQEGERDG